MSSTRIGMTAAEKVPPQSLEAERAALGAMLLGNEASREAIAKLVSKVQVDDFYRTAHQKLYAGIRAIFDKGEKVDMITVTEWLRKNDSLEQAGGHSYIAGLVDEIPLVSNVDEYARIISEKAVMRRLMEVGNDLFGRAIEDAMPVDDLVNGVSQILYEIAQDRFSGGMQPINQYVLHEIEKVEQLMARAGEIGLITGLPTGFELLDQLTSGLHPAELIVLAARPGMGKTSFALNVAEHIAMHRKVPVLIFSLEMSAQSLVRRLLCAHARVDSQSVRRGQLFGEDRARIMQAFGVLNELPIWIDESSRLTPIELRARARRILGEAKAPEGEGIIIVDYMQMMDCHADGTGGRPENRQQEITAISRSLKAVAKELKMPVLVLSQLSRAPERRDDSRPRLSDLRESGAIEQDADVVIFLYRDKKDATDVPQGEMQMGWVTRLSVAKQRNGPTGAFPLYFNRQYTRFDLLETSQLVAEDE